MQKKKNTKFKAIDIIVVFLCIAGAVASGAAFWQEYDRTLTKINDDPVGTIVFKKRTAQRKFIDRVIWDRLKQTSPIYNGDTIRTIEYSEAIVTFRDEITYLSLDENTMIQVFYNDKDGAKILFTGGSIGVNSGARNVTINNGSQDIMIGGEASLVNTENGFSLFVRNGEAVINGEMIEAGEMLALDAMGTRVEKPMIAMTSFGNSARFLGFEGRLTPVTFSWNEFNFNSDTRVIIQIAEDSEFKNVITTVDSWDDSRIIPIQNGSYRWRAYPAQRRSNIPASNMYPSGIIEIIPSSSVILISPSLEEELNAREDENVLFSWTEANGALYYFLEISRSRDMNDIVFSQNVEGTRVNITELGTGHFYWRVTPFVPQWINGEISASRLGNFSISSGRVSLDPPVLLSPLNNETITPESDSNSLNWVFDPKASSWFVEVADNTNFIAPYAKIVTSNYINLPQELMQEGRNYFWRVSALGGINPVVSNVRLLKISVYIPLTENMLIEEELALLLPEAPIQEIIESEPEIEPEFEPEPLPPPPVRPPVLRPAPARRPAAAVRPQSPRPPAASIITPSEPVSEKIPEVESEQIVSDKKSEETLDEAQQEHIVQESDPLVTDDVVADLLKVSPLGAITNCFPPYGYIITTAQLLNVPALSFSWEGGSSENNFALYRSNGDVVIPPTLVRDHKFTLQNPSILTEGNYVWQVFEKDRRGNFNELPSIAYILSITDNLVRIRILPTSDPGVLYGNQ